MTLAPKNTWYCSKCDFYVFNTKLKCNKCSMKKPMYDFTSYDPQFDKSICNYFTRQHLNEKTDCVVCKTEGRIYNKDPLKSNHNCWKYS